MDGRGNLIQEEAGELAHVSLRLTWISGRRLAHELAAWGLTVPQFITLVAARHHQANCTMSELAEAAEQVTATMTGIIDRLVERDLVSRSRDAKDRRAVRVSLTDAGENLLTEIQCQRQAQLAEALGRLEPGDRQDMLRSMHLYLEAILQSGEVPL